MQTLPIHAEKTIIERKICYDSSTVDHTCRLLKVEEEKVMLFHEIETAFTMKADQLELTISKGSFTIASFWLINHITSITGLMKREIIWVLILTLFEIPL